MRHFGGFGLGLFVVRRIIEAHGGRVTVWSEPGEGTLLTVELPIRLTASLSTELSSAPA